MSRRTSGSAGWDVADKVLQRMLQAWVGDIADDGEYLVCLYQNEYKPDNDTTIDDFEEATFGGYSPFMFDPGSFGAVSVVDHVAITTASPDATFSVDESSESQTIYGYFLLDDDLDYIWGESFKEPKTVNANDKFGLTIRMKHRTCR